MAAALGPHPGLAAALGPEIVLNLPNPKHVYQFSEKKKLSCTKLIGGKGGRGVQKSFSFSRLIMSGVDDLV